MNNERRIPKWWERWVNPTTVLALIGGVVWGVQLNTLAVANAAKHVSVESKLQVFMEDRAESHTIMAKQTVILDNIIRRLDKLEYEFETHETVQDRWQRDMMIQQEKDRKDNNQHLDP